MQFKLKISSQGQVTLPKELLKLLGLKPGDYLPVFEDPDSGEFFLQNELQKIDELGGALKKHINPELLLNTGEEFEKALENSQAKYYKRKY